jgi:hypothetical protein
MYDYLIFGNRTYDLITYDLIASTSGNFIPLADFSSGVVPRQCLS